MKRKMSVFTAKKAIRNYNENLLGFNDILTQIKPREGAMMPEIAPGTHPDEVMARNGTPATFSAKRAASKDLGMSPYKGGVEEDMALGRVMGSRSQAQGEKAQSGAEQSLKEREFALKEKESEEQKMPTAEEIASAILKQHKEEE